MKSIFDHGLIAGGQETNEGRRTIFFTPLNPFGKDEQEEAVHGDLSVQRKLDYSSNWKHDQDAVQEVKFDQEASITDVKFTRQGKSCGELRSVGRLNNVSKVSLMSASTANALIEKSVREMQSTVRTIAAYTEWVYGATFELGSASSTWTAEIVGHAVSGSQSCVSRPKHVKTTCGRRKPKSCCKALVKFGDVVMLMTIEKPRHQPHVSTIMLNLVDRSDEVVPTTYRVVQSSYCASRAEKSSEVVPETRGEKTKLVGSVPGEKWNSRSVDSPKSGCDVRRRVPAKTAYGGGATRASGIGRKS